MLLWFLMINMDCFFRSMISDMELCSVHGQRISLTSMILPKAYELDRVYTWHILEFGHHLKRLDEMESGHPNFANTTRLDDHREDSHDSNILDHTITNKSIRTVLTPSIFLKHGNIDLFQEDVITTLPYREIKMDNMRADWCFVDQERVVAAVSPYKCRCIVNYLRFAC